MISSDRPDAWKSGKIQAIDGFLFPVGRGNCQVDIKSKLGSDSVHAFEATTVVRNVSVNLTAESLAKDACSDAWFSVLHGEVIDKEADRPCVCTTKDEIAGLQILCKMRGFEDVFRAACYFRLRVSIQNPFRLNVDLESPQVFTCSWMFDKVYVFSVSGSYKIQLLTPFMVR